MTEHSTLNRFAESPARGAAGSARTLLVAVGLTVFAAGFAPAQDEDGGEDAYYRYGSLAAVEGDVWHQRADEFGAEEAEANSPFLPGDRIWTREPGKVEIRFSGWITAWMDEGTKLDYVEADRPHRLGFWTGSLLFRVGEESEVVVETPGGTLTPQGEGLYRLDVLDDRRTVQFGVREGIATVGNEAGSVLVRAGNRTAASAGEAPSAPESWRGDDDFADWAANRQARFVRGEDVPYEDLPEEVREHVHDLDGHGRWAHDHDHGWIWYPAVAAAWSPYHHGRWAHTPFGYTWISYDPWGWAPFHYGRWGHGPRGWYWLPGHAWSPGWVSWAYGYDWIGWSPLSPFGYPVYGWGDFRGGGGYGRPARGTVVGTAVPRGTAVGQRAVARGAGRGWSFTRRDALGRAASRNRLAVARLNRLDDAQVLERGAVLDRGLRRRAVGETAIARSASVTARGLANTGRSAGTVASRRQRAVGSAGRTALGWRRPAERHRADPAAAAGASSSGTSAAPVSAAARRVARPRTAATREAAAASGRAASASGRSPSATGTRAARPRSGANSPRSGGDASARGTAVRRRGGAAARTGARPAASARPRSGAASSARPSSGVRNRPGSASRARPRSGASSRPTSASRSRPSSRARPRPSSSARSRPSSTSRSRPSSGARARPSSSARSRPSSTSRSRPSSGARSRPSSSTRSRPSSTSRSRPSSGARSRPSSGARSAPRSSGSRARPRRPNR